MVGTYFHGLGNRERDFKMSSEGLPPPWRDVVIYFNEMDHSFGVSDLTHLGGTEALNRAEMVSGGLPMRRFNGCKTDEEFIEVAKQSGLETDVQRRLNSTTPDFTP